MKQKLILLGFLVSSIAFAVNTPFLSKDILFPINTDVVNTAAFPKSKIVWGADGETFNIDSSHPLPVAVSSSMPVSSTVNQGNPGPTSSPWPVTVVSLASPVPVSQSGSWTTGRTWNLLNTTDSVDSVQSGTWTTGRTWSLLNTTDSVNVGNFPSTFGVTQSTSPWVISGTVTANIGTTGGLALDTSVNGILLSQGSTTSGETGPLIQGAVTTVAPSYTTAKTSPLSITTAGALRTDSSATTQPISGIVTANQGGTWNINNITGTVSLPTNAAQESGGHLASVDTKLGTGPVAQDSSVTNIEGSVAPGTAAIKSVLIGAQFNTTPPTLTNGQQAALQLSSDGGLMVDVIDSLPTGSNVIGAVTQSAGPWTQNVTQFGGSNIVTGTGASGSGIPRITISNDSNILATQSGTWTVQQGGTPTSIANAWPVKPTDGTNTQSYTASGEAKVLVTPLTNASVVKAQLQDNSGAAVTLGQKVMASSLPVVVASDQSTINVQGTGTTGSPAGNVLTIQGTGNTNMAPVIVGGAASVGTTPTNNPVPVSGVDGGNLKRSFLTDTSGRIEIDTAQSLPTLNDFSTTGSLTAACASGTGCAAGSTLSLSVHDVSSARLNVSGTFVGTILADISTDNFTTFATQTICGVAGVPSCSSSTGITAPGYFSILGMGAVSQVRARMSAFTSGSATVVITASQGNGTQAVVSSNAANFNAQAVGNAASASADSGNPVKIGGVFNTVLPTLTTGQRGDAQMDSASRIYVTTVPLDGAKPTYSAAGTFAPALLSTDLCTLTGSASKTIRVLQVRVSIIQTAGGQTVSMPLIKRSTADSGGTSSTLTAVPHDSSDAAATAVAKSYTANPTLGTAVGNIRADKYVAGTSGGTIDLLIWDFANRPGKAIVLRGTSEQIVINSGGTTFTSGSANCDFEWTEEP